MTEQTIFKPGINCWRKEKAYHASLVVDCANYYRDLHESMSKARHSIFITGWDIDSRVELLRGDYVKDPDAPRNLYDLLTWKAQDNPDLKIYLNRWDYALLMAETREPMGVFKWRGTLLENIYFCRDDMVPFGACHHQKVIVIDDEVAYTGGMDIALNRWDTREHFPQEEERSDPGGVYDAHDHHKYGPYHDIMTVVSGPAARAFAELSRERWKNATGYDPIPLRNIDSKELPQCWPDSDGVDFTDIDIAIARTLPPMESVEKEFYIEQIYLDEISRAEKFIYMENQYYTRDSVAKAINDRLRKVPNLKVVMVSSFDPQGMVELKSMWTGRIKYYKVIRKRGVEERVVLAYPASQVSGVKATVRIHSKFMVVDDKFMHVGSANMNNRSMRVDTECDLVYAASTEEHRKKITAIRNDLIKEHTGREPEETEKIINSAAPVRDLIKRVEGSRQYLEEAQDERDFPIKNFATLAMHLGDPNGDFLPDMTFLPRRHGDMRRLPYQRTIFSLFLLGAIAALLSLWHLTPLSGFISPDNVTELLEELRKTPGSIVIAIGLYVAATILFIPVAAITLGVAAAFGPWWGIAIAVSGAMIGSLFGYLLGRIVNPQYLGVMMRTVIERVRQQAKDSSIPSITFLRMLPIAPFSVVNLALGIVEVRLPVFLIGTFLGFLPGTAILAFMGDSFYRLWQKQDLANYGLVGTGIVLWIGIIAVSQFLYKKWEKNHVKAGV